MSSTKYYEPNAGHLVQRPHCSDSLVRGNGCPRCDQEELEYWDRDPAETCWSTHERRASLSAQQQTDDLTHLWSLKGSPKLEPRLWSAKSCNRRGSNGGPDRGTLDDPVALDLDDKHPTWRTKSPEQQPTLLSVKEVPEDLTAHKEVVTELNDPQLPRLIRQPYSQEQIRHNEMVAEVAQVKNCEIHGEYQSFTPGFLDDWHKL